MPVCPQAAYGHRLFHQAVGAYCRCFFLYIPRGWSVVVDVVGGDMVVRDCEEVDVDVDVGVVDVVEEDVVPVLPDVLVPVLVATLPAATPGCAAFRQAMYDGLHQ